MSKKNNSATLADLRGIDRILKKGKVKESKIKFERIGEREDLMIVSIGDVSFKSDKKAIGGVLCS